MNQESLQRIHRATAWIAILAALFYLFFQINKHGPLGEVNPFAVDPYDAVGSFAFQIALLIAILTYARALRLLNDSSQATRARLILRGNLIVLGVILITLLADATAEIANPFPPSFWGNLLQVELGTMFLLVLSGILALIAAFSGVQTISPPGNLTPADGIDDLWTLVRFPVSRARRVLPPALVAWVRHFDSDWLFSRIPWLDPRLHPWRFACALGFLVGVGLALAHLEEGLPPSLVVGLIATGIFLGAEFTATLLGYAVFGGFLGLRPSFHRTRS